MSDNKRGVGLYVGSFNPMTIGHEYILLEAARSGLFDDIIVCRGINPDKLSEQSYMSFEELKEIVEEKNENFKDVSFSAMFYEVSTIQFFSNMLKKLPLTKDYSIRNCVLIRGLRSIDDFEHERFYAQTLAQIRQQDIPIVYFMCCPDFANVSSSMVRGLIKSSNPEYASKYIAPYDPEEWSSE